MGIVAAADPAAAGAVIPAGAAQVGEADIIKNVAAVGSGRVCPPRALFVGSGGGFGALKKILFKY